VFNFQLQDKSISSLVKFYYSWKKTRSRTSLIDRQAKRVSLQRDQRYMAKANDLCDTVPWIPEPSTVNNKLKRREGSGPR
jgi:hypothetical protein